MIGVSGGSQLIVPSGLQVFAIELVTFAVDFVPLAVEFGAFAVEFVALALQFVALAIELDAFAMGLGAFALELVAFALELPMGRSRLQRWLIQWQKPVTGKTNPKVSDVWGEMLEMTPVSACYWHKHAFITCSLVGWCMLVVCIYNYMPTLYSWKCYHMDLLIHDTHC